MGKAESIPSLACRIPPASIGSALAESGEMEDLLQTALESANEAVALAPATSANAMVFVMVAVFGVLMALVYVPVRLFLTLTARSRRLRLLLRIRRLREELGKPIANP